VYNLSVHRRQTNPRFQSPGSGDIFLSTAQYGHIAFSNHVSGKRVVVVVLCATARTYELGERGVGFSLLIAVSVSITSVRTLNFLQFLVANLKLNVSHINIGPRFNILTTIFFSISAKVCLSGGLQ